jgi:hypothetical protein
VYDATGNLRASGDGFQRFCSAVGFTAREYGIENNIMLLGEEASSDGNGQSTAFELLVCCVLHTLSCC